MTQAPSDADKTIFHGLGNGDRSELPSSIRPVTPLGTGEKNPRRNTLYIAQQTSLEDYTPGLNPLVNAAAHLLLEIVRLREQDEHTYRHQGLVAHDMTGTANSSAYPPSDIEAMRSRLEAEVRGFEAQALASDMDHSQVLAARYVLCTAVDEAISTSVIAANGEWSKLALLSTFHNETWGGEKFFQILDRCMQQPARNLYLLELMYLLLSLGFEGKYRLLDRGPLSLESLRDKIYRQIRLLRGEPVQDLSKKMEPGAFKDKTYAYIPLWMIAAAVLFCLSVTFFGFSTLLDSRGDPLLKNLASLSHTWKTAESGGEEQ